MERGLLSPDDVESSESAVQSVSEVPIEEREESRAVGQRTEIRLPDYEDSLQNQSIAFAKAFEDLHHNATVVAELDTLIKSYMRNAINGLDDLRERYTVWLCDVDAASGGLSAASATEEPAAFSVVRRAFARFRSNFRILDENLSAIDRSRTSTELENFQYTVNVRIDAIQSAVRNLADVAPLIGEYYEEQQNAGSYADFREHLRTVRSRIFPHANTDDGQVCEVCTESIPAGITQEEHRQTCLGERNAADTSDNVLMPPTPLTSALSPDPGQDTTPVAESDLHRIRQDGSSTRSAVPDEQADRRVKIGHLPPSIHGKSDAAGPLRPPPQQVRATSSRASSWAEARAGAPRMNVAQRDAVKSSQQSSTATASRAKAASVLYKKFKNIDDAGDFTSCWQDLLLPKTWNFVVDFANSEARCATDLDTEEYKILLASPRTPGAETRWINFWGGDLAKDSIDAIVEHYGISPRLVSLLCSKATARNTKICEIGQPQTQTEPELASNRVSLGGPMKDPEKAFKATSSEPSSFGNRPPVDLQQSTFGEIVDDIWHFCSVDWGQGYLHVGYNSLYSIPGLEVDSGPDKPSGKRIWSSLVLCADGTVISVSEKAFPDKVFYPEILKVVRRNTLNVFRHLSKVSRYNSSHDELSTINIRDFDTNAVEDAKGDSLEMSSLLFYYLFDDWITSYSLAARKDHSYGEKLEKIRLQMFETADIDLIDSLHRLGRQIAVLKRIYQSLELIINRIISRQHTLSNEARTQETRQDLTGFVNRWRGEIFDQGSMGGATVGGYAGAGSTSMGVRLSDSATFRFERLLDRIGLYAVSRIDEYMAEKESLVQMNFNLIALKDSQATEKLTRVTVLLSKIAAVFLPLSLMTAYFSTQIQDLQHTYTAKSYWVSFMVITLLSILFLVIFGVASETVEGRTIYKSLTRIAWTKAKRRKTSSKEKSPP